MPNTMRKNREQHSTECTEQITLMSFTKTDSTHWSRLRFEVNATSLGLQRLVRDLLAICPIYPLEMSWTMTSLIPAMGGWGEIWLIKPIFTVVKRNERISNRSLQHSTSAIHTKTYNILTVLYTLKQEACSQWARSPESGVQSQDTALESRSGHISSRVQWTSRNLWHKGNGDQLITMLNKKMDMFLYANSLWKLSSNYMLTIPAWDIWHCKLAI